MRLARRTISVVTFTPRDRAATLSISGHASACRLALLLSYVSTVLLASHSRRCSRTNRQQQVARAASLFRRLLMRFLAPAPRQDEKARLFAACLEPRHDMPPTASAHSAATSSARAIAKGLTRMPISSSNNAQARSPHRRHHLIRGREA